MTLVLSLLVVGILFGGLFLLLMINKGSRANHLRQCADRLALKYRPFASLSRQIREAAFFIINIGQFQNFRHLIEGQYIPEHCPEEANSGVSINIFDYSMVGDQGTANQTLLLLDCPLSCAAFRWQAKEWLKPDTFNEPVKDSMQRLHDGQINQDIRHWRLYSKHPAELPALLSEEIRQWLLAHPHLHIEWSNGILLLYRPQWVLDAEQIEVALNEAMTLITLLQQQAPLSN